MYAKFVLTLFFGLAGSSLFLLASTAIAQDYQECNWQVTPTHITSDSAYIVITYTGDEKQKLFYGFASHLEFLPNSENNDTIFSHSNAENLQCAENNCEGRYKLNVKKSRQWQIYLITASHKIAAYETRKARIKPILSIQNRNKRGAIADGPLPQKIHNKQTIESNLEICSVKREFYKKI